MKASVYEIASMTTQARRKFNTPLGTFTYARLPLPYYAFGIRSEKLADDQYAMVASPEKALCDKIITTSGLLIRSKKTARDFLLENMRMDEEALKRLTKLIFVGFFVVYAVQKSRQFSNVE